MDATTMNIRERLDQLAGSWSETVGQPYILKINPNMLPVNVSAVAREGDTMVELSAFVESELLPQLEGVEGVASISTSGLLVERIHVLFDQQAIDALNERIRAAIDGQFTEAEDEIATGREELADAAGALSSGQRQLNSGKEQLNATREESEAQFAAAQQELTAQRAALLTAETQLTAGALRDGPAHRDGGRRVCAAGRADGPARPDGGGTAADRAAARVACRHHCGQGAAAGNGAAACGGAGGHRGARRRARTARRGADERDGRVRRGARGAQTPGRAASTPPAARWRTPRRSSTARRNS